MSTIDRAAAPAATASPTGLVVATLPTPAGDLVVVVDDAGTVRAAGFGDAGALLARLGRDARPVAGADLPDAVADAVRRYSGGDAGALASVPVAQAGGAFHQEVWRVLRTVPAGRTVSYTELAAMAGRPAAVRAAASACARNLVAPFVPCHRVLRTDGTLGGYAYGLDAKRALLAHERRAVEG